MAATSYAFVSGSLWGVFAVLTKEVVARLGDGGRPVTHAPELYAWLLAVAGGFVCESVGVSGRPIDGVDARSADVTTGRRSSAGRGRTRRKAQRQPHRTRRNGVRAGGDDGGGLSARTPRSRRDSRATTSFRMRSSDARLIPSRRRTTDHVLVVVRLRRPPAPLPHFGGRGFTSRQPGTQTGQPSAAPTMSTVRGGG